MRITAVFALLLWQAGFVLAQQPAPDAAQSVALAVSADLAPAGKLVTLQAKVAPAVASRVTFFDGATILGTASVNRQGEANFSTASLAAGFHKI
jgi:hypothetical protein